MTSAFDTRMSAIGVPLATRFSGHSASVTRNSATVTMSVLMDVEAVKSRDSKGVAISRNTTVLRTATSTYNFGDGLTTPSPVDEFLIGSRRFEPRKPDGMGDCWEYSDGTSAMLKIYVEEVSA